MDKKSVSFEYYEYDSIEKLPDIDKQLLSSAINVRNDAYSPYSLFKVGAAILLDNGEVITGNNQENAAYPSGTCAERVAAFYASSKYPGIGFKAIAVTASSDDFDFNDIPSPCGACRQVLLEYEKNKQQAIRVIMGNETGKIVVLQSIADLLPFSFFEKNLKK